MRANASSPVQLTKRRASTRHRSSETRGAPRRAKESPQDRTVDYRLRASARKMQKRKRESVGAGNENQPAGVPSHHESQKSGVDVSGRPRVGAVCCLPNPKQPRLSETRLVGRPIISRPSAGPVRLCLAPYLPRACILPASSLLFLAWCRRWQELSGIFTFRSPE